MNIFCVFIHFFMIPKIIHQVWEGKTEPLPEYLSKISETWKKHHPQWRYEFWNGNRMEDFVKEYFPDLFETYVNYRYPVQRWDAVRYLILYKIGGMYVDFDYDCLESFECYTVENGICYFAMEPEEHCQRFRKDLFFNNALMLSPPFHPFFECIVTHLQTQTVSYTGNRLLDVLNSTGPLMLTELYETYPYKSGIEFFTPELVSPWTNNEVRDYINGTANAEKLEQKLKKAKAIHYFFGSWL